MNKSRAWKRQRHLAKSQRRAAKTRAMRQQGRRGRRTHTGDSFLHIAPPPTIDIMRWLAQQRTTRKAA